MILKIQKAIPNMIAQFKDKNELLTSRNYAIYKSVDNGETFTKFIDVPVSSFKYQIGKSRLISRTFRLGIKIIRKLKTGTLIIVADKKVFRYKNGSLKFVHLFSRGTGPLREGFCEDHNGNCYMGEYFLNNNRDSPVYLFKSEDDGNSWNIHYIFKNIRHIHCVQYDPFSGNIWVSTGDTDKESGILFSKNGKKWTIVGSGNQKFRAVSLLFTENYVYWGSDAPTKQNYIYKYIRKTGKIERLIPVDGPIHYSTMVGNFKLFATTHEGNSEGKSGEWDKKAHIWGFDGEEWSDLISWRKDKWPYIMGYGRVLFPVSNLNEGDFFFTTQAITSYDHVLSHAKLIGQED